MSCGVGGGNQLPAGCCGIPVGTYESKSTSVTLEKGKSIVVYSKNIAFGD